VIHVEQLCKHNDAKRRPLHENFGISKWPKPNQCSKLPHTFALGVSGPCNKWRNNPSHVIGSTNSKPDLEGTVNGDKGNQRKFKHIILRLKSLSCSMAK